MKKPFPTNRSSVFSSRPKPESLPASSAVITPFPILRFTPGLNKYGGMEEPEVKRLKSPDEEHARLKMLPAKGMLDKEVLQVALG